MKYKLFIFDLDGTAIPSRIDALPSPAVVAAVARARQKLQVSVATGRAMSLLRDIFRVLELESPCVISGGTQIVSPATGEILSDFRLHPDQVSQLIQLCRRYPYEIIFNEELSGAPASDRKVYGDERVIYLMAIPDDLTDQILQEVRTIPDIGAHTARSWTPGCFDIHITHARATKKHAIGKLQEMLKIDQADTIVVGDQNNDLPLFESAGFRIAMGNASAELKSHADFIAPSVDEDGLAYVVDKFILSPPHSSDQTP